jgi:hypothetical protein
MAFDNSNNNDDNSRSSSLEYNIISYMIFFGLLNFMAPKS